MIAYEYIFLLIGISFVICLPLVLLLKTPNHGPAAQERAPIGE